jgi:predicted ArsR family transcriptional regulator
MPAKLSEIAEKCGVSRQTVNYNLKKLGLWDEHVKTGESGQPALVDDFATSAVVAKIGIRNSAALDALEDAESKDSSTSSAKSANKQVALSAEWSEIVAALRTQAKDLQEENDRLHKLLDEKDQRIMELNDQVGSYLSAIKKLPSADAVADAKTAGEAEERRKIASMGFFERRRYLRG